MAEKESESEDRNRMQRFHVPSPYPIRLTNSRNFGYDIPSGRMAIVLATFILAVQEILYLVYFALLFINDRSELNSLVAKNACYTPQGTSHSSHKQ